MKTKGIIIILSVICLLLLVGVGRSHIKIKELETTISKFDEKIELLKEHDLKEQKDLDLLQGNFEVLVWSLYPEEEEEPQRPSGPPELYQ